MTALQVQAQETIAQNVLKHTMALCEALRQNYIDYSIRSHKRSIEKGMDVHYHTAYIQDLRNGKCDYDFTFDSGKKYHKVIMHTENQRSVHCFIDKNTGEVYKSASWKSPAKGVRYDMRIIEQREWMFENADWAGGYLYAR
jgi:hypothetical protein